MDLRSYSNTKKPDCQSDKDTYAKKENPGAQEADIRRAIKHFSGLNNDQLMQELSRQLAIKRKQGKESEVSSTIERIKPFLNAEQQKRLNEIMKNLK